MGTAEVEDRDVVQSAIRLGWYTAEVRGRNRPDGPPGATPTVPERRGRPLPLRVERSAEEQRIQAQVILAYLADKLGVDTLADKTSFGATLDQRARELARARAASPADAAVVEGCWGRLADLLWTFDSRVQDVLTARSDTQACGYQLGRGLAETYWALDPEATAGWSASGFLLGAGRCAELVRLAGRLSAYMLPFAASAIAGSIEVWKAVAASDGWRSEDGVGVCLYEQLRTWYELMVLNKDPTGAIRPFQYVTNWRATGRALVVFGPQLLLAAVGVAAVSVLAYLLAAGRGSGLGEALSSVIAALGLSVAGLSAKAKSQAQALQTRFRQDLYTELIAVAITTAPTPPRHVARTRDAALQAAIRQRTLTSASPLG